MPGSLSATCPAWAPHIPCAPGPGGVAPERVYILGTPMWYAADVIPGFGRSCQGSQCLPPGGAESVRPLDFPRAARVIVGLGLHEALERGGLRVLLQHTDPWSTTATSISGQTSSCVTHPARSQPSQTSSTNDHRQTKCRSALFTKRSPTQPGVGSIESPSSSRSLRRCPSSGSATSPFASYRWTCPPPRLSANMRWQQLRKNGSSQNRLVRRRRARKLARAAAHRPHFAQTPG